MRFIRLARPPRPLRSGPFLLPASLILVVLGLPAVVLTLIHLANEMHRQEHSPLFAAVVVVGSLVFLAGLVFANRGSTLAVIAVAVLAFGELALQLSTHFAAGPLALSALAPTEGIWFTIVLFFLAATCLLTLPVAVIATTNAFGHARRAGSRPLVGVSVAGALLVLLHAWMTWGGTDLAA